MDDAERFHYRSDVLAQLLQHGVRPTGHTRPDLVRDRYLRRDFPKTEYAGRVDALRRRYPVLALHAREFVEL